VIAIKQLYASHYFQTTLELRFLVDDERRADQCGGIPEGKSDLFQPFGERRGCDHSGLGLGLSIARQSVRAHGGDIHTRNTPGEGCIFTVDVPLAAVGVSVVQGTPNVR
jgi:signal transduction histidine kinase